MSDIKRYTLVYYQDFKMQTVLLSKEGKKFCGYTSLLRAMKDKTLLSEKYPRLTFYVAEEKILIL